MMTWDKSKAWRINVVFPLYFYILFCPNIVNKNHDHICVFCTSRENEESQCVVWLLEDSIQKVKAGTYHLRWLKGSMKCGDKGSQLRWRRGGDRSKIVGIVNLFQIIIQERCHYTMKDSAVWDLWNNDSWCAAWDNSQCMNSQGWSRAWVQLRLPTVRGWDHAS